MDPDGKQTPSSPKEPEPEERWDDLGEGQPWKITGEEDQQLPTFLKPILMIAVMALSVVIMFSFRDELAYFLGAETIDLGSVQHGCDETFYKKLRHNAFAKVRDALPQPHLGAEAKVHFQQRNFLVIVGCDLMVSLDAERYKKLTEKGGSVRLDLAGRLLQFQKTESLQAIRKFYEKGGAVEFNPRTYLLADGERPGQKWYLVPVYLLLLFFFVFNLYKLIRFVQSYFEKEPEEEESAESPAESPGE